MTALARSASPRSFDVPCTIRVSHMLQDLGAHVELDGDIELGPGDKVRVHGEPIHPSLGESIVERRLATVTRATWLERLWIRFTGDLACLELLDVSFSDRRTL